MSAPLPNAGSRAFTAARSAPAEIPSIEDWLRHCATAAPADILVFQNVYSDQVIDKLDPSFLPIDGRRNARTDSREVGLFLRLFHSGLYCCAPLTGILSPKFSEKSRISGDEFLRFIRRNPGYDVYFINPWPQNSYHAYNVWYQGELCHAGLASLAEMLFLRCGLDKDLIYLPRDAHGTALYSNYWVGGHAFWDGYVALLVRLLDAVEAMPPRLRERYLSPAPNYPDPVPILTFILERTFSAYLHMNPQVRALAYPFTRDAVLSYCTDGVEYEIVSIFGDFVDEIDQRKEYSAAEREFLLSLTKLRAAAIRRGWW